MTTKSNPLVVRNKSRSPPPLNFLKLNVDAHLSDDGRWGFGSVLRGEDGHYVGATTRVCKGSNDVATTEAMSLREALMLVESNHLSNIIIELDVEKIIVNAMLKRNFHITH
ncbi:hypothetical protein L195_g002091 [Trifolium pratense]|uniref:RNase H type-1 domain-containing protein n=1 Tax=Trifolium pratense TaxID=57577 RepID=A0A2K3NRI9_TRIPR|nr:hypothetical protein L195_g002091 [Trifolium pratense]